MVAEWCENRGRMLRERWPNGTRLPVGIERNRHGLDILLYVFFFNRCFRLKNENTKGRLIRAGACVFVLKIVLSASSVGYSEYFSILLSLCFCCLVYKGSLQVYAIWVFIAVVTNGIVNFLVLSCAVAIPEIPYEAFDIPGAIRTVCILASKCLLFLCYFVMTIHNQHAVKVKWRNAILLMFLSIGCWALLNIFFQYSDAIKEPLAHYNMQIIGSAGMLLVMMASTILYNQLGMQEKEYANMQMRQKTIQMTSAHIQQQNIVYQRTHHHVKNHLTAINRFLADNQIDAAMAYINELNPSGEYETDYVENIVLDALISARVNAAKSEGIDFIIHIVLPVIIPISDVSLIILFGSLLDNAFEAVARLPKPDAHFVEITTKVTDLYWVIACRNSADQKDFETVDYIPSTKNDAELHGIGTRHIVETARETGGYAAFVQTGGVFTATVLLKLR
jgi:hypothetical protein